VFRLQIKKRFGLILAGIGAGAVNGLFGAGGGMVLVPLLTWLSDLEDRDVFPASVSIILPMCFVSLGFSFSGVTVPYKQTFLYIIGSAIGGIAAGLFGRKIPTLWLHRLLGALILWGGIQYLC